MCPWANCSQYLCLFFFKNCLKWRFPDPISRPFVSWILGKGPEIWSITDTPAGSVEMIQGKHFENLGQSQPIYFIHCYQWRAGSIIYMTLNEERGPGFREGELFWSPVLCFMMPRATSQQLFPHHPSEPSRVGISFIEAPDPPPKKYIY